MPRGVSQVLPGRPELLALRVRQVDLHGLRSSWNRLRERADRARTRSCCYTVLDDQVHSELSQVCYERPQLLPLRRLGRPVHQHGPSRKGDGLQERNLPD